MRELRITDCGFWIKNEKLKIDYNDGLVGIAKRESGVTCYSNWSGRA